VTLLINQQLALLEAVFIFSVTTGTFSTLSSVPSSKGKVVRQKQSSLWLKEGKNSYIILPKGAILRVNIKAVSYLRHQSV